MKKDKKSRIAAAIAGTAFAAALLMGGLVACSTQPDMEKKSESSDVSSESSAEVSTTASVNLKYEDKDPPKARTPLLNAKSRQKSL